MDKTIKKILVLSLVPFIVIVLMMYRQYSLQNNSKSPIDNREVITNSGLNNSNVGEEKFSDELSSEEKSLEQQKAENSGEIIEDTNTGISNIPNDLENTSSGVIYESDKISSSGSVNPNIQKYFNDNYSYGFEMPKNIYYSGFGSKNNSNHSVGIFTGTGTENFDNAAVKVYFYSKKLLPELNDLADGEKTYVDGKYFIKSGIDTIVVEGAQSDKITQAVLNNIVRTK